MRVSTKGRYGLRVMIELAAHYGQGPVPVETIAAKQDISANYIHALFAELRSANLIRSVRGPRGGYELAKQPAHITALDVVSVLEGWSAPVACVDNPASCSRQAGCVAREVWCEVAAAVKEVLSSLTLAELAERQRAKLCETIDYQI